MTTQKKKKSAKEKRVLIGSVVVATAIVAGSTFAWFSSKDEVTNRLTASADYNVSIVEDFQPPKDWIPGQTINKDVSAVNTGNVDAFVRMWLDGKMRLLSETTPSVDAKTQLSTNLAAVTDESRTKLGLNYYVTTTSGDSTTNTYYKTLSTKQIDNPQDEAHAQQNSQLEENNQNAKFSEVQSVQAGGVLVYAPADAAYHWTLEQATVMKVGTFASNTETNLPKGTVVGTNNSTASGVTKIAGLSDSDSNYYGEIDASTFKPETDGLYIFRRNIGDTNDGTENTYEYSGYYFVSKDSTTRPAAITEDTYFALHTGSDVNGHSDYVLPANAVTENDTAVPSMNQVLPVSVNNDSVYLFTATEEVISDLTWVYDSTSGKEKFTVTKPGATANKNIVIEIALANINANEAEAWTAIPDTNATKATTFYYNNDLEAGDTSRKLVDSVKLSENTEVGAYLAFDFDLNVFLDSVQVTTEDQTGKETNLTINPWRTTNLTNDAAAHSIQPAKGEINSYNGPSEIAKINWTYDNT